VGSDGEKRIATNGRKAERQERQNDRTAPLFLCPSVILSLCSVTRSCVLAKEEANNYVGPKIHPAQLHGENDGYWGREVVFVGQFPMHLRTVAHISSDRLRW
jgi:hypothetical protein